MLCRLGGPGQFHLTYDWNPNARTRSYQQEYNRECWKKWQEFLADIALGSNNIAYTTFGFSSSNNYYVFQI